MVKYLHDICLNFIQSNLDKIPNAGERLPTVHKELLLERIADHDLLIPEYIPFAIQQLFSSSLRHVTFYKCDQVTDEFLCVLANRKCVLDSLTIQRCQSVTGKNKRYDQYKVSKLLLPVVQYIYIYIYRYFVHFSFDLLL